MPHQGTWREAATYRDALESHVPLLAFSPELGPGRARVAKEPPTPASQFPDAASFAEVSPANVVLSTLRLLDPEAQGNAPRWELRLYETAGRAADAVVRLASPVGAVRETNLLGEPAHELGKIEVDGSQLRFRLPAWKIVTLQVTPAALRHHDLHEAAPPRERVAPRDLPPETASQFDDARGEPYYHAHGGNGNETILSFQGRADMSRQIHRRDLLRAGAAAGLAAGVAPAVFGQQKPKTLRLGVVGVGGRGTHLLQLALGADVEVPALCDIKEPHLNRAVGIVEKGRGGRKPEGYSKGPKDYLRMLERDDLDAIICATGMQVHAEICIAAMRAGKDVLSEVAAAMTLDECWGLVRAQEETGRIYMLSENCCYWPHMLMVRKMVQDGLFGAITYAECGYVHDCRGLAFDGEGKLTWRGEMARDFEGNLYPTHDLGPIAKCLGINRGDRLVSLVAAQTRHDAIYDYVAKRFPEGHPAREVRFKLADSTSVLLRTAKGVLIDQRFDMYSARPASGPYHALQGVKGSYDSRLKSIWIDGRSKGRAWEPQDNYAKEFEHPLWTKLADKAEGSGHGGADFFVVYDFLETVRNGGPAPVDVYDAAAWSSIIPLSGKSLAEGGTVQEIPDFTNGKWETVKGDAT